MILLLFDRRWCRTPWTYGRSSRDVLVGDDAREGVCSDQSETETHRNGSQHVPTPWWRMGVAGAPISQPARFGDPSEYNGGDQYQNDQPTYC